MTAVVHLVVGPDGHGVVRHGTAVAQACAAGDGSHRLVRRAGPDAVEPADLEGADVVHVPFTDRLFGPTAERAADAFAALADTIDAAGPARSVTLHDLPAGDSALAARRRSVYRTVVAGARGLVVSSRHELRLALDLEDTAWSRQVVALPVDRIPAQPDPDGAPRGPIGILGFLYPGKGIEDVLREAPDGATVRALGGAADGHEDQPGHLAEIARSAGVRWETTGYLPDDDLAGALAGTAVPVAPHRTVSASGSIATWIAHGRRPLVPDVAYTREIDAAWPGTVRRYDAGHPGALRREIELAVADPARTVVAPDVATGPTVDEVARRYRSHLAACAPPAPVRVGSGWAVPGQRTDLLDALVPPEPPAVSVVVPYYDAQSHLDLVLTALARQDHPAARLEVVVADDGSPRAPRLDAAGPLRVRSVRQPDEGFRAAAARNLGAGVADGEVLAFLDGDTVPETGYVTALCRLPALSADGLTVGRRRHAAASDIGAWLAGAVPAPSPLPEPAWLTEGYAGSRDLRDADERSYRFVISAVLALHRDLFADLGGFCEEFRAYGGEDWELAARAWHAGALFAHVPGAVAWHVGPDWAGRGGDPREKAVEQRMLDQLLPDPEARAGTGHRYPATVVVVDGADGADVRGVADAVERRGTDAAVWWPGASSGGPPGVRAGDPPPDALARAGTVVHLDGRGPVEPLLAPLTHGLVTAAGGRAWRTRAVGRARRHAGALGVDPDELVARWFGRRDLP